MRINTDIQLIFVDLFAGAGGVTTGVESALVNGKKVATVIAAVNHDAKAIESHKANHPNAVHFIEDIRTLDMSKLIPVVKQAKLQYPNASLVLWASLECTNFSNAKGGMPREADSRTLADHLPRYIEAMNPLGLELIYIENVKEFMSWGPLDDKGKPVSRDAGIDYVRWYQTIQSFGYSYDWRLLNAANYGAYTSRIRFFGQFTRNGMPAIWPEATHAKGGREDAFTTYQPWKAVKEVLDFSDEGTNIFDREIPLVEKSLERIYAGLVKFVAGGKKSFILKYNSRGANGNTDHVTASIDNPSPVVTTQNRLGVVQAFLMKYHGNGYNRTVDEPCPTVATHDGIGLVHWIDKQYGSGAHNIASIEVPAGALLNTPKLNLVKVFLMDTSYNNIGSSIEDPAPVILANRKQHYLVNPQYQSKGGSVDDPCFTLIARMDKMPPYLVSTQSGQTAIVIYEDDSPMTIKIKEFMAIYGIAAIKMRMLRIRELKLITGFPESYHLAGTQADQKKFIGNAVPTIIPQRLCEAQAERLLEKQLVA